MFEHAHVERMEEWPKADTRNILTGRRWCDVLVEIDSRSTQKYNKKKTTESK